jgi:FkbM family methyltransferase
MSRSPAVDVPEHAGAKHHPAVLAHRRVSTIAPPGMDVDFLGTKTRHSFEARMRGHEPAHTSRELTPHYPRFNEEYFEWVDILEAVAEASGTFVMVELGAGYGRWLMRAASALQNKRECTFCSVAVEPEPDHFRWLLQNYRDNGIEPTEHDLTWAAIGGHSGFVPFWIGDADGWYGQALAPPTNTLPDVKARRRLKARSVLGRPPVSTTTGQTVVWVPQITLSEILLPYPRVDLIDLDVQGAEVEVLEPAMGLLTARVRRVHIGTHDHSLEARLRDLFTRYGWQKINDFGCQLKASTIYGDIEFSDGVQNMVESASGATTSTEQLTATDAARIRTGGDIQQGFPTPSSFSRDPESYAQGTASEVA